MSEVEHIIRVTAPNRREGGDPVVHHYTVEDLVRSAYNWGRNDGASTAKGEPLFGEGKGWTTAGVSLDDMRATFKPARRD